MKEKAKFTPRQEAFIQEYLISNNATQAAIKAGYSARSAKEQGHKQLTKTHVRSEIDRRKEEIRNKNIATAQEVMEYFTKVMNGEIKDQFGLEASLADRTRAAQELARRTVDIENRANGKADTVVNIELDWTRR